MDLYDPGTVFAIILLVVFPLLINRMEMQRWAEDAAYAENENAKELEAALLKLEGKNS